MRGIEWIIDAHGCDPAALRDVDRLRRLFDQLVDTLQLTPVAEPLWHRFPAPGGVTGMLMLAESHLACHTFPEFGSICLNLFCCRARPPWDGEALLAAHVGAAMVTVRQVERVYAPARVETRRRDGSGADPLDQRSPRVDPKGLATP